MSWIRDQRSHVEPNGTLSVSASLESSSAPSYLQYQEMVVRVCISLSVLASYFVSFFCAIIMHPRSSCIDYNSCTFISPSERYRPLPPVWRLLSKYPWTTLTLKRSASVNILAEWYYYVLVIICGCWSKYLLFFSSLFRYVLIYFLLLRKFLYELMFFWCLLSMFRKRWLMYHAA